MKEGNLLTDNMYLILIVVTQTLSGINKISSMAYEG